MNNKIFSECPEEVVDNRSLYERLQEQKNKKDEEYQEQFALSESQFPIAFLHFIFQYWHGPNTQCFDAHLLYLVIVWHPMLCFISFIPVSVSLNIDIFSPFMVGASSCPHWKCFFYRNFVHLIPAVNRCFWF